MRPLLVANCHTCHSAETNSRGGLRVDDRNGLLVGGEHGAAVIPGKPEESLLIKAVRRVGDLKMPPERPLSDGQVAILTQWIRDGAAWTRVEPISSDGPIKADYQRLRKEHWAWQPLREPPVPPAPNAAWPRDDIDRFLLVRMAKHGLKPDGDAERLTLIRRATFDLTGLPPTLAEIDTFLTDRSETAFERVVDRLLSSPAFGERWGRHWLDIARYGESTGSARNLPYPHAWRYRDYVIDAFNKDKPYDEFVREQIAGDLLPAKTSDERVEHLIATGFLALGVKDVNQRFKVRFIMDNIDEQIDTVSLRSGVDGKLAPGATIISSIRSPQLITTPWRESSRARTSAPPSAIKWAVAVWTTTIRSCFCASEREPLPSDRLTRNSNESGRSWRRPGRKSRRSDTPRKGCKRPPRGRRNSPPQGRS